MIWLGVLVAVAVLAAIIWYVGGKPALNPVHSLRDILRAFTTFEVGGKEGALLFIGHKKSTRFLQFVLSETAGGRASISFGFPNVTWSARWFSPLRAALGGAGFAVSESAGSDGTQFLDVDGLTVPQAMVVTEVALAVLELGDLANLRTRFDGPMGLADFTVFKERLREYESVSQHA